MSVWVCLAAIGVSAQTSRLFGAEQQCRPGGLALIASHGAPTDASRHRSTLNDYCITCHNQKLRTAGLTLDTIDLANVSDAADTWEKVIRKLRAGEMPPAGARRPDRAALDGIVSWLETALDDEAKARPNPGRPLLRRFNRTEYANAIRDLVALEVDVASLLPLDDSSHGFDNIADVLGVSPLLIESYMTAARRVSRLAVGDLRLPASVATYRAAGDGSQERHLEGLPFGTRGGMLVRHYFPLDAAYQITVQLQRDVTSRVRGIEEPHEIEISVDGVRVGIFTVGGKDMYAVKEGAEATSEATPSLTADAGLHVRVPVKAGLRLVAVTFPQKTSALMEDLAIPFFRPFRTTSDVKGVPHVGRVAIGGPYSATDLGDTPSRRRIFTCRPRSVGNETACARTIISTLARRAYRRSPTDEDLRVLLEFYQEGRKTGGFDHGIEFALRRILASPQFVFRIEHDPENVAPGAACTISQLELASRLSFFLWSSIPDDELLSVAIQGKLTNGSVLERQVRRMLADPRSEALVSSFVAQWLYLRNLPSVLPNPDRFRDFDDTLRQAFRRETELLFDSILRENRSVLDLLSADYTFMNERLARHYGVPNVSGSHFRRVAVTDNHRRGLLGHGGILTVTSYPTRTSPVQRGKWVLENLLGTPPPPPPPNAPDLKEARRENGEVLSMRERMAQHRTNPVCAGCHSKMDPIGLSLENFDAVGAWRDADESNRAIDASTVLPDGTKVDGVVGLREALLRRPEIFVRTATEKLLTYAVGRGLESYDAPAVRAIVREAAGTNYALSSLIMGIVKSTPFLMRRSEARLLPTTVANR